MPKLDEVPSIGELFKTIGRLSSGKALGKDCIPTEVIKNGKSSLPVPLHKLLTLCCKEVSVPQDMRDADIITLYKNKGDCNNYCGISLLSIINKLFVHTILHRLKIHTDRNIPRVTVCLSIQEVSCRHDLLHFPTAREVQRTESAILTHLHRPDQGIWSCKQRWSIQDATTN